MRRDLIKIGIIGAAAFLMDLTFIAQAYAQDNGYRYQSSSASSAASSAQSSGGTSAASTRNIYNHSSAASSSTSSVSGFRVPQDISPAPSIYVRPSQDVPQPQQQPDMQTVQPQQNAATPSTTNRLKVIRPASGVIQTSSSNPEASGRIEYGNVFDTLRAALPSTVTGSTGAAQDQAVNTGVRVQDGSAPSFPIGMNRRVVNHSIDSLQSPQVNTPTPPTAPQVQPVTQSTTSSSAASASSMKSNPSKQLNLLHDMITKSQMGGINKPRTTGGLRAGGTSSSSTDSSDDE